MRALLRLAVALVLAIGFVPAQARQAAREIDDTTFWRLISDLSETSGVFSPQLMSNEDSAQFVIPALAGRVRPGGVYIGVGSEQNFTYIATLRPRLAFIVDIRRDNLLEMLMYKALFELSADRADFVSRLFARPRPIGLDRDASPKALFAAYATSRVDPQVAAEATRAIADQLTRVHSFPLNQNDLTAIAGMHAVFGTYGPQALRGIGDPTIPTFADLMAATDLDGQARGFLASEELFGVVKDLQRRNMVVPITGDFAGDTALKGIASYLATEQAAVDVFYVSNVESYLFDRADEGASFYANVAAMPRAPGSVFVRSVTREISQRLGITLPSQTYRWWTFLSPISGDLAALADGRIREYRDLFAANR